MIHETDWEGPCDEECRTLYRETIADRDAGLELHARVDAALAHEAGFAFFVLKIVLTASIVVISFFEAMRWRR